MREIKFRAWDKKENRMEYCPGVKRMEDWLSPDINGLIKHCQEDEDYILMLYTGLKDKNDKKIFEGDIVNVYHTWWGDGKISWRARIQWNEESAGFRLVDKESSIGMLWCSSRVKVIGNIYENPELLEK